MRKLFLFTSLFALGITAQLKAQMAYTRAYFTGAYTPVSGSATALTFSSGDDGDVAVPLPFNFTYAGTAYTATTNFLIPCTNGWAQFSTTGTLPTASAANADFFTTNAPNAIVAPWWDDLNINAVGTNAAGGVSWEVTGVAPNRVMTVQWTVSMYYTTTGGQPKRGTFQLKLYETTNVVEFWYGGTTGTVTNTNEAASVGIKDATGGNNHYVDGMTGSGLAGNLYLQASQMPKFNLRFSPGAPTAIAAGTYNVGVGQAYRNITDAFADLGNRGISGPVVMNLTDALYDTTAAGGSNIFPLLLAPVAGTSAANTITVTKSGAAAVVQWGGGLGTNGQLVNQASNAALSSFVDPIVALVGADRVTINNLDIRGNIGARLADFAIGVFNGSATDGAQNNTFTSITTTLNRANTGSIGIRQNTVTTATAATGSNSNNIYKGLTVKSSYAGIYLSGTSAFPDDACEIGTAACGTFNVIGDPLTANDIGNGSSATWGIRAGNQSNVKVYNNIIVNVTCTGATTVDGIFIDNSGIAAATSAGTCSVNNNNLGFITSTSTGTGVVRGIRCTLNANAGSVSRIYNNTVSSLNSASTSVTASRKIIGISLQDGGGGAGATHNVDFNSVRIAPAIALCNNTCFEVFTTSGPVMNVRDNIFANFTGAQTTVKHYCWVSTSATAFGNTGSISNYNDLYVNNTTNGFTALGNATDYATLANWQAITSTPDLNSIAIDPLFSSAIDLHASAAGLDNVGNNTGITWVTGDIDCQTRPQPAATNFDIGADEISACAGAPTAGTAVPNPISRCGSGTFTLQATGASTGIGITYQWKESTVSGGPYTNCTTGSGMTSSTYTTASISTTMYYVCVVTCSNSGIQTTSTEAVATILANPPVAANPTSGAVCAGGTGTVLNATGASTYTWAPSTGLSATTGSTVTANPTTSITYTVTGTGANGCTATATSALTITEVPSLGAVTATPSSVCSGGNSQLQSSGALTTAYTITNIPFAPIPTPGTGVTTLANGGTATIALDAATTLDDGYWMNRTIPFNFTYFGTIYTSFAVSTNGFIWLGTGAPNTYTAYNNTMPSATMGHPAIGPNYADLDWRTTGVINYFTTGAAPNRKLVINYQGGQFYNGVGNITTQLIICETSNIIEVHTTASSGTNPTVEGIQNAAGTTSFVVTGRNNTNFTVATPDAYRWSPSGTPVTYSWSPATFLSSTTINNPMANGVTATTTYTVTVANGGCTATGSVTVTAGSALTSSGNISPASTVCAGTNVTLNSTPVGGGSPYTYSWTGPNSFTSTQQSPTLTSVTTANSGVYTLIITDNCLATNTVTLTLNVNGLPSVAVTPNAALFCNPGPGVSLSATGATTYSWAPATGLSATTGSAVTASPTSTSSYTVTGTDGNGCVSTASTTITTGLSVAGATATSTATAVCTGSTVDLSATANPYSNTLLSENFNTGAPAWTRVNNSTGGTPANAAWTLRPDGFVYAAGTPYHSNDNSQFIQSNSDAQGSGSTTNTLLVSPVFSTTGYSGIAVNFFHYYRDIADPGDSAVVEASLNGTNWTIAGAYTVNTGSENAFAAANVTLPAAFDNQATVYVRFRYIGTWDWYWSIDNVSITGNGTNFTYNWTSSPAGFTSTSQNNTGVAPTATTTYSVTLTNITGCSATASTSVVVNPLPTVTASASSSTVCSGNPTTLTGGGSATTFSWMPGSLSGSPVTVNPTSTTTYTVTGTDGNGCTNTATQAITVNALPTVTASASSSSICAGNSTSLTGGGATTYTWMPGSLSGSPVTVSPTSNTTYTVTGTDANGCQNTATQAITVNPLPVVTLSGTNVFCAGGSTTLTGTGGGTSQWYRNGVLIVGATSNTYVATTAGVYNMIKTNVNGCADSAATGITVTVNALPNVTSSATSGTICAGNSTSLSATGANTYSWMPGSLSGTPVTVTPASTTSYTVTGTNTTTGCTNTSTVTVTVNALPNIVPSATSTSICTGNSVSLSATGGTTYTWNPGSLNGSPVTVTPASTTTYTVQGTDANGCSSTGNITITVGAQPTVTASSGSSAICTGNSTTLTGNGAATYTWMPGSLTGTTVTVNPTSTTTYTVTGVVSAGCQNTAQVTVTVNTLPTVTGSSTAAAVCAGNTVTLTGNGATSYSWTGGVTDGVAFTPVTTDTYTVTGTDGNGCTNTATVGVTVNALPTVTASATATTICDGTMITLTGNGATSYSWTGGVTDGVAFAPNTTNTYTVTGTDGNGCTNTDNVTVTVNPTPVVNLGPDQALCSGTVVLDAQNAGATYLWIDSTVAQTLTVSTTGTYYVDVTNGFGCTMRDSVVININANPMVTLGADIVQCGGTVTLDAQNAGATYLWIDSSTTQTITVSTSGTYGVTATYAGGCNASDTINITINPVPTVNLGADVTQCGGTVTLDAMNPGDTYLWIDSTVAQTLTASSSGTYWVDVTNGSGCTTRDSINVMINSIPTVNLGNDVTQCGGTVTLDAGAGYMYLWIDSTVAQTLTASSSGMYAVTVTDSLTGCSSNDSINVTINAIPNVTFSIAQASICVDDAALTLSASPAGGTFSGSTGLTGNTFSPIGLAGSTETIVYTYTDPNTGCSASQTDAIQVSACTGIIDPTNDPIVVNIYPNPSMGLFTLEATSLNGNAIQVELFNAVGQIIDSFTMNSTAKQMDIRNLEGGVYLLRISDGGHVIMRRVVKQ